MDRLVLKWLDSPWAFELMPGLNTLGRNPTNDFRVSDPSISSFHAEVTVEGDKVRVRDLGSTNGTFVGEARIEESELKPEDVMRLGNVRFQLDLVPVIPAGHAALDDRTLKTEESAAKSPEHVLLEPHCAYHPDVRANYRCESCAQAFCASCVKVLGQGKFEPTTICPVCHGQCYPLLEHLEKQEKTSFLARLTQTLKIPFFH